MRSSQEMENWPTYYPMDMSGDEIKEDMLEHAEKEYDEHVWLSLKNAELSAMQSPMHWKRSTRLTKMPTLLTLHPIWKSWPLWMANIRRWWTMPPGKLCCSATVSRSAIWWTITV